MCFYKDIVCAIYLNFLRSLVRSQKDFGNDQLGNPLMLKMQMRTWIGSLMVEKKETLSNLQARQRRKNRYFMHKSHEMFPFWK